MKIFLISIFFAKCGYRMKNQDLHRATPLAESKNQVFESFVDALGNYFMFFNASINRSAELAQLFSPEKYNFSIF